MASPEKIAPLPETLPEDFSDWDGEASAAPSRGNSSEWEQWQAPQPFGKSPTPVVQSADRDAILESLIDRPPALHPAASGPALVKQHKDFSDWDSELSPAPKSTPAPETTSKSASEPASRSASEPVSSNEWEAFEAPHLNGNSPKPLGRSSDRDAMQPQAVDRPPASDSASSAPVAAKQQKDTTDWDRELALTPESAAKPAPATTPTPAPVNRDEWEAFVETPHSFDKPSKPLVKPVDRDAILDSLADRPQVSRSVPSVPVAAKQQRDSIDWDLEAPPKPSPAPAPARASTPAPSVAPSPAPVARNEWEALEAPHSLGRSSKPLGQSADRDAILAPVVDKPRASGLASPAPTTPKPQKYSSALVEVMPGRISHTPVAQYPMSEVPAAPSRSNVAAVSGVLSTPELATAAAITPEAEVGHFPSFQSLDAEAEGEKKEAKKKWMLIAVVSICSMLLLLYLIGQVLQHGAKHPQNQPIQTPAAASDSQPETDTSESAASVPETQQKRPATPATQIATGEKPAKEELTTNSAPVQAQMMNDQLTAPAQIPQGIKKQVADNAPPPESFSPAGVDGLGGNDASGNVFNGQARPIVSRSKPVTISAGVVEGMLIQKSPPVYPSIARAARVSGTVVLEATISKTGTIKDVRVVSGPVMLRSAAADAVRTWRYRPYKLNNEPVEIQSTINVIFSLNQ